MSAVALVRPITDSFTSLPGDLLQAAPVGEAAQQDQATGNAGASKGTVLMPSSPGGIRRELLPNQRGPMLAQAPTITSSVSAKTLAQLPSLPGNVIREVDKDTGRPSYLLSLKPVPVQLKLPIGPGGRLVIAEVKSVKFYGISGDGDIGLLFQLTRPVTDSDGVSSAFSVTLDNGNDSVSYEEKAKLLRHVSEAVGGVDKLESLIDLFSKDLPPNFIKPAVLAEIKQNARSLVTTGEAAVKFEMQRDAPTDRAEQVIWRAQQLEKNPEKTNALLERLGTRYGIPGGGRPWTEWLNDRIEVPVANAILKAAARFKDVSPQALATILFGEGAGFHDIARLKDDYASFNSQQRSGFHYYGLDTFGDIAATLKRKGYLPENFKFLPEKQVNELKQTVNSAKFLSFEDTVLATAATWQHHVDVTKATIIDKFGRLPKDPQTLFFYTYVLFNAGPAVLKKTLDARGVDYVPQWNGTPRKDNDQSSAIYNATVRVMQLRFFDETGVFSGLNK